MRRRTNCFNEELLDFFNICIRDTSFPSRPEIYSPHAGLRFAVGDEVSCNCNPWQTGRVVNSPYFDELGQEFPYQVMLNHPVPMNLAKVIYVPFDGDGAIKSHFVTPRKMSNTNPRVRLIQLKTKSLNGKCGRRGELNQETGRYAVTLEDGKRISVKPENMEIIPTVLVVSGKSKSKKRKGKSQLIKETRTADAAQSEQAAAELARDSTHTSKQVWHEVVTSAYFDDADYQQHLFLLPSDELVYGDLNGLDEVLKTQSALAYDKVPPHSSIDLRLQYSQSTFPEIWKHSDQPPAAAEQEEREETRSRLKRATHLLIITTLVPMNYQEGIEPTSQQIQLFQTKNLRECVHLILGMCRQRQFWDVRTGPLEFARDGIYNVYKILMLVADARAKENAEKQLLTFEETRHLIALYSLCIAEKTRTNLANSDRREYVSDYAMELAFEQIGPLLYNPKYSGEETFMCIVDFLEKSVLKTATPSQSVGRGCFVSICITLLNNGDETAGYSKPCKHPNWVHVEKHIVPFVKSIAGILDQLDTIDVDTGSHLLGACGDILAKPQFYRGGSIASLVLPSCRKILQHGKYSTHHMRWEQKCYNDLLIAAGIGKAGGFVNKYSPKVYDEYLMKEWNNQNCASRTLIVPCRCHGNLPSHYCTYQKIIGAEKRAFKNHQLAEKNLLKKKYLKANRLAMKSYLDIEENWERYHGVKGNDRRSMLEKSRYLMGEACLGLGDYSESIARFMEVIKDSLKYGVSPSVIKLKSLLSGAQAQLEFSKVQKNTRKKKSLVQDAHKWLNCLLTSAGKAPSNFWTYDVDAVNNTAGRGFYKSDHVEFSEWTKFHTWNHLVRMEWDEIGGGENGFNSIVQKATHLLEPETGEKTSGNEGNDSRNIECEDIEDSESNIAMRAAPAVAAPCRVYMKTWRSVGSIANADGGMDTSMYICERLNLSIQWVRGELLIWNYGLKEVVCWINNFPSVSSTLKKSSHSHRFCAWDTSKSSGGGGSNDSGNGSGVAVLCMFTLERDSVIFLDFLVAALKPKTDALKTDTTLYGTHMSWHQVSKISSSSQGLVDTILQHPKEQEFIISLATFVEFFGASNLLATHCSKQNSSWSLARQPAGSLALHIYKGKESLRPGSPFGPIAFVANGNDASNYIVTPTLVVDAAYQHIDTILAIEFCDGNDDILCTSSHDRVVKVWNIAIGQEDNVAHCLHSLRFDDPAVDVSNRPLCFVIACTPDLIFCAPHIANYSFLGNHNSEVVTYDTMHGGTNRAVVCWSIKDGSIVAALDSTHATKKLESFSWNSNGKLGMTAPNKGFDDSVEAIVPVHFNNQVIIGHKTGEINIWKIIKNADPVEHNKEVITLQHMRGLKVMEKGLCLGMTLSLSKYSLDAFPNLIVANGHGFVALVDPGGGICKKDDTWMSFSLMELCDRDDTEVEKTSILQVSSLNCGQLMNCGACMVWSLDSKKCSRCKKVCFCNKTCMRNAWKEHKKVCVKAVKSSSK